MKALHRPDAWCWSSFDAERNVNFHSYSYRREGGGVLVEPLPMSERLRYALGARCSTRSGRKAQHIRAALYRPRGALRIHTEGRRRPRSHK